MYRIVFDPKISKFVVQLLVFGFFWKVCSAEGGVPFTFNTYSDAVSWTERVGLPEAYVKQSTYHWLYGANHAH